MNIPLYRRGTVGSVLSDDVECFSPMLSLPTEHKSFAKAASADSDSRRVVGKATSRAFHNLTISGLSSVDHAAHRLSARNARMKAAGRAVPSSLPGKGVGAMRQLNAGAPALNEGKDDEQLEDHFRQSIAFLEEKEEMRRLQMLLPTGGVGDPSLEYSHHADSVMLPKEQFDPERVLAGTRPTSRAISGCATRINESRCVVSRREDVTPDLMSLLDHTVLAAMREDFQTLSEGNGGQGIVLAQFVDLMWKYLPLGIQRQHHRDLNCGTDMSYTARNTDIATALHRLFHDVDVNGDGSMEWSEFTQHIVDAGMSSSSASAGHIGSFIDQVCLRI